MDDLFVHQLQDVYYAEKQLVKALPKMAEKATDKPLKQGFPSYLEETKNMCSASNRCSRYMVPR
jgi:ferritin-like metal-binding protein YciE